MAPSCLGLPLEATTSRSSKGRGWRSGPRDKDGGGESVAEPDERLFFDQTLNGMSEPLSVRKLRFLWLALSNDRRSETIASKIVHVCSPTEKAWL